MMMLQTIKAFVDTNKQIQLQPTVTAQRKLEAEMIAALKQDAEDQVYQSEIMAWDSVVGDGTAVNIVLGFSLY
jgi:hypothetical protein